jgi:hypothetical protein
MSNTFLVNPAPSTCTRSIRFFISEKEAGGEVTVELDARHDFICYSKEGGAKHRRVSSMIFVSTVAPKTTHGIGGHFFQCRRVSRATGQAHGARLT